MSAPTPIVRAAVYERDGRRCVACDTTDNLTFQHRRATGMGGSKTRPPAVDGLTACAPCNARFESDMQTLALANGWKVRRFAKPENVPLFYPHEFGWFRLHGQGRSSISAGIALVLMHGVYGGDYYRWRDEVA